MFTLYLDDSGTRPSHKIAVATALVIPTARIPDLEKNWEKLKAEKKFTCFHASSCNAKDKKFANWRDTKVNKIFSAVRKISREYGLEAISAAIVKDYYDEIVPAELRRYTGTYHYTWCVDYVIAYVKKHGVAKDKPLVYLFDHMELNDPARIEIEKVMEYSDRAAREQGIESDYTQYNFAPRCEHPGLQCVDEIAWCCNQYALHVLGKRHLPRRAEHSWKFYGGPRGPNGWLKAFHFTKKSLRAYVAEEMSHGLSLVRFRRWEKQDSEKKLAV